MVRPPQADDGKRWKMPAAAVAAGLAEITTKRSQAVVFIATSERRADEIAAALSPMVKDAEVLVLPPWDCLPYDRAAPSRERACRSSSPAARRSFTSTMRAMIRPCSTSAP